MVKEHLVGGTGRQRVGEQVPFREGGQGKWMRKSALNLRRMGGCVY